jgi:chemotaxis methyl-accepting protein methylase
VIPADDAEFAALSRQIARGAGLTLEVYKDKCVRRRIAVRMRACGVHTYADYQALLERSPREYDLLRDALTINVTRFYRNADTWSVLRREVIPALVDRGRREFRAWSAGCSSGEEPYTLAMLVTEHLEQAGRSDALERTRIEATDIDRICLERARAGIYRREMLSELPPELMSAYFQPDGADLRVVDRVRRLVTLTELDLGRHRPLRRDYHLILCRNVVIYFDRATQERLFQLFTDALAPGGYLVLGKVETLFGAARERLQLVDPRERIYRRPA